MKISQFRCHCALWWLIRQSVKRTDEVKYGPLKPVSFSTMAVAYVGCKPFQQKKNEIEILASSDSVFSPDSNYGFEKS